VSIIVFPQESGAGDPPLGFDIRLMVRNVGAEPVFVTIEDSYFSLEDDVGRQVTQVEHFCCAASNEPLDEGQEHEIQVVFRLRAAWIGKEVGEQRITFHVRGFLPVTHAAWKIPLPLTGE
jgi:hypothetical protein